MNAETHSFRKLQLIAKFHFYQQRFSLLHYHQQSGNLI